MATSISTPEQRLVEELGKLHPAYTVMIDHSPNEVFPYLLVTDGKQYVRTQIRLPEIHWSVAVLDRLVTESISRIEALAIQEVGGGE